MVFDVLVNDFDPKGADLLVEVKSSVEMAHVRMAVGQLFDYVRSTEVRSVCRNTASHRP